MYFYDTIPKYDVQYSRALSFFPESPLDSKDPRVAFIDRMTCNTILPAKICNQNSFHTDIKDTQIIYQRINPTKYRVTIKNATEPFLLVFQNSFSPHWKLYPTNISTASRNISDSYFNGGVIELMPVSQVFDKNPFETNKMKSVYGNTHVKVNGYANAWYIQPSDLSGNSNLELILEMTTQKTFYYFFIVSAISLLIFLLYGVKLLMKQKL